MTIIESVDSVCRNSADTQYMLIQISTVHLRVFSWQRTHPVALKCVVKVPNQKVARRPKCFLSSSSSDGLVQNCVSLLRWFSHKTAFYAEQCTSPSLFCNLQVISRSTLSAFWTMVSPWTPFCWRMRTKKSWQAISQYLYIKGGFVCLSWVCCLLLSDVQTTKRLTLLTTDVLCQRLVTLLSSWLLTFCASGSLLKQLLVLYMGLLWLPLRTASQVDHLASYTQ